jgi:hypothetical protein
MVREIEMEKTEPLSVLQKEFLKQLESEKSFEQLLRSEAKSYFASTGIYKDLCREWAKETLYKHIKQNPKIKARLIGSFEKEFEKIKGKLAKEFVRSIRSCERL